MNVLIVEDEPHTSTLLKELIEQEGDFMVVETLESVLDTVDYLQKYQHNIDLLFLDIQLADGMSFEIFRHIDVHLPVVFCTAFDSYSLQAFKNNGIDYILKPFKEQEIRQTLTKYKRLISTLQSRNAPLPYLAPPPHRPYQKSFLTQYREKTIVKPVEEVALFMVEQDVVYLYSLSGGKYPISKKLEYLASVCDPQQFYRINRKMLVSRAAIASFEPYFNRKILLQLGIDIPEKPIVSRLKVSAFKNWLRG